MQLWSWTSRCYDAPMQFIGQKVEVRYLPDDPEKVWVFSEGKTVSDASDGPGGKWENEA